MLLNETLANELFLIEKIDEPIEEIEVLKTIGISEGKEIMVLGKGYINGSVIVSIENYILQLNPYFIKKIHGSLVDKKKMGK